jgi:hypothetical protein
VSLDRSLLRFQEKPERCYFYGTRKLPGISSRLELAGLKETPENPSEAFLFAGERGTAVHRATELEDLRRLDVASVDPRIVGYVEGWRAFKRESGWLNVEAPEVVVADPDAGFATKVDRVGTMESQRLQTVVLNIKTGAKQPWWPIQSAGEASAYGATVGTTPSALFRRSLQLFDDGRFMLHPAYTDRNDFKVWNAATIIAAWRERNPR